MKKLEILYRYLIVVTKRLTSKQLMIILAILVGLLAGFGTFVFEWLLYLIKQVLVSWFQINTASFFYLVYPVIGIVLASLFVRYIIKDNISEGVTRVLYAMSKKGSRIKPHNCYSSIVGGATTIGFGGSVGPEAPIVLTGAAIGSNVGKLLRLNYKHITLLLCCGAAAALSAIFKAPITGVVFVLEILMLDITVGSIIPLLVATVTATSLAFFLNGFEPMLSVTVRDTFELRNLPIYTALGLLCGLISYYFTAVNAKVGSYFGRFKKQYQRWAVGGLILGVLIFVFPPLYGEGYESFIDLLHGNPEALFNNSMFFKYRSIPWVVILYLVAILFFKVVAMSATNAAGGVGGTFAPSLFVGAFTGAAMAYICNTFLGFDLSFVSFTLVGMAGVMSGVMKAPLTSIFLIAELSNGYRLFVPLMLVAATAFAISYYFEPYSIYTKKLHLKGELLTHNKDRSVLVFLDLKRLMETDFRPISRDMTVGDLVSLIATERRNIFPVLDDEGVLLGVVQLDDLRPVMFDPQRYGDRIDNYMIPPPDIILSNEQIASVLQSFEDSKAWMLPVVDTGMHYLGFISKSRILAAYREQLVAISDE
ncbi:MAG: chloride channel protein [Rikenellaceae bacterium]|nr:chloride channel protein [Rikenellaceae bacterium]